MSKLSIVVSTIRPGNWLQFCQNLLGCSVELEVIFVGPCNKTHSPCQLPLSVKFISTNIKPSACWEAGVRIATGDFLCLSCDDFSYSQSFFDDAIKLASTSKSIYDTFSPRFIDNHGEQASGSMFLGYKNMPLAPIDGISFTEGHHRIGGIDKYFHATLFDCDLYQRMFVAGGRCTLLPGHVGREFSAGSTLFIKYSEHDKILLKSLWFKDDKPTFIRSRLVEKFDENDLIQISNTSTDSIKPINVKPNIIRVQKHIKH